MNQIIDYRGGRYKIIFVGDVEVSFYWCKGRKEFISSNISPEELRNPLLESDRHKIRMSGNYDR